MSDVSQELTQRHHIALIYQSKDELDRALADYLNKGLERGHYCIFATIHFRDRGYVQALSTRINNYQENIDSGNLLVIDLAPYYLAALTHDLRPFHETKEFFEKTKGHSNRNVQFVSDATGFLFRNRHFDECAMIEGLWQQKPFEGSYVCPYQEQFLDTSPEEMKRQAIWSTHDLVVNSLWNEIDNRQPVTTSSTIGYKSNDNNVNDRGAN